LQTIFCKEISINKSDFLEVSKKIFIIRNRKVILDSDLVKLYGIQTKALTRQIRRNINRFPDDFLIMPESR
jgi:hypothetical protein